MLRRVTKNRETMAFNEDHRVEKLIPGWLHDKSVCLGYYTRRYYHHNGRRRVVRKEEGWAGRRDCDVRRLDAPKCRHTLPLRCATPTRLRALRYVRLNHIQWRNKLSTVPFVPNSCWFEKVIHRETWRAASRRQLESVDRLQWTLKGMYLDFHSCEFLFLRDNWVTHDITILGFERLLSFYELERVFRRVAHCRREWFKEYRAIMIMCTMRTFVQICIFLLIFHKWIKKNLCVTDENIQKFLFNCLNRNNDYTEK